jgi:hypothetical protein
MITLINRRKSQTLILLLPNQQGDELVTENTNDEGKITLGLITSWSLGILFLLAGLAAFTTPNTLGVGVPLLLVALLLLPPIRRFVHNKTGKSLSTGARFLFAFILLGIALMPSAPHVTSNSATVPASQPPHPVSNH